MDGIGSQREDLRAEFWISCLTSRTDNIVKVGNDGTVSSRTADADSVSSSGSQSVSSRTADGVSSSGSESVC